MGPPKTRDPSSNNDPIEEITQPCPKGRIDLIYLRHNGDGVPNAKYHIYSVDACGEPDGFYDKKGTLDGNGRQCLTDVPEVTGVRYYFESDPTPYTPAPMKKLTAEEKTEKELAFVSEAGAWIWGTLQGDFNKDPSISQIAVNTVLGMIPLVDQVLDIRDIIAGSKHLFDFYTEEEEQQKKHEDVLGLSHETFLWVNVFLIALGCIPVLGSAIKGVCKALIEWLQTIGKTAGELSPKQIKQLWEVLVETLNSLGVGNAHAWLKDLSSKLKQLIEQAADILRSSFEKLKLYLEKVRDVVKKMSFGGSEDIVKAADKMIDAIGDALKKLEDQKKLVNDWLGMQFDSVLAGANKWIKHGSGRGVHKRVQRMRYPAWIERAAKAQGVSGEAVIALRRIAAKHNVIIKMRPTNKYALDLLESGTHLPKPSTLKAKTINDLDKKLGAKGQLGEASLFPPNKPTAKQIKENPEIETRYKQRLAEWNENQDLAKGLDDNHFVDENYVVRSKEEPHTPYAGDNDIYSIESAEGKPLTDAEKQAVQADLENSEVNAQHEAHVDWPANDPKEKKLKQDIVDQHTSPSPNDPPGTKKEKLMVYSNDDPPTEKYSDE